MNGFVVGADEADLRARAERLAEWQGEPVDLYELAERWIVGTPERVVERAARVRRRRASAASCSSTTCTATTRRSS